MEKEEEIKNTTINKYKHINIDNSINTTNNTNNITNNINIVNFRHEDVSDLTDKEILSCFHLDNMPYFMASYIELVNANPNRPQNMNVLITNVDNDRMSICKNGKWQTELKENMFNKLYEYRELEMDEWTEANKNKYPKTKKTFDNYIRCSKEDEKYRENCKRMSLFRLYDKRDVIIKNYENLNKDITL